MRYLPPIVLAFAIAALVLPARAAPDDFERLFGKEVAAARSSRDPQAIVKCAEKLIDAGDDMRDQPDLQAQLYFHAFDLAMLTPDAYVFAQQAMETLAAAQPDKKPQADERLLSALRKQFQSAADNTKAAAAASYVAALCDIGEEQARRGELADAIKTYAMATGPVAVLGAKAQHTVVSRLAMLRKIESDEPKLQKSSDAKANTELALDVAIELNRWGDAAKFPMVSGETAAMLSLASAETQTLSESDCLKLGDWCSSLTERRTEFGKINALERAAASYGKYLSLHAAEDGEKAKFKLMATKVDDDLAAARAAVAMATGAATAKITLITPTDFSKTYATMFPEAHNLAAGGVASASASAYPQRPPSIVFSKPRATLGWYPGTSKATFSVRWPRPPVGRYVLLYVLPGGRNTLTWLDGSTLRINNEPPQPVLLNSGDEKTNRVCVFIVDLGRVTLVRSLELDLNQDPRAQLLAIEVHRAASVAAAHE